MPRVEEIHLSRDAYLVCSQHVHTTDGEEVMGLLVGCYTPVHGYDKVVCVINHAVILRRSDKRKDRVEISPEMLIQAQQKAEEISMSMEGDVQLHIVGWYHSHPKITVAPSAVDLRTQMGYQQMDDRFVGLIFSVFNKSETTKVHEEFIGGFQAINCGQNSYERRNIPIRIKKTRGISAHNQEAVCSLSNILQQEQLAVLAQSRQLFARHSPMQHLYNSAVAVQRVVDICEKIPGPLSSLLHCRNQHMRASLPAMDDHIHYLTKLIKDTGLEENYRELSAKKFVPHGNVNPTDFELGLETSDEQSGVKENGNVDVKSNEKEANGHEPNLVKSDAENELEKYNIISDKIEKGSKESENAIPEINNDKQLQTNTDSDQIGKQTKTPVKDVLQTKKVVIRVEKCTATEKSSVDTSQSKKGLKKSTEEAVAAVKDSAEAAESAVSSSVVEASTDPNIIRATVAETDSSEEEEEEEAAATTTTTEVTVTPGKK